MVKVTDTYFSLYFRGGYVIGVLGDHPKSAYSSVDAVKFRDWLIGQGLTRNTTQRVCGIIRSIVNLAIEEQGLGWASISIDEAYGDSYALEILSKWMKAACH